MLKTGTVPVADQVGRLPDAPQAGTYLILELPPGDVFRTDPISSQGQSPCEGGGRRRRRGTTEAASRDGDVVCTLPTLPTYPSLPIRSISVSAAAGNSWSGEHIHPATTRFTHKCSAVSQIHDSVCHMHFLIFLSLVQLRRCCSWGSVFCISAPLEACSEKRQGFRDSGHVLFRRLAAWCCNFTIAFIIHSRTVCGQEVRSRSWKCIWQSKAEGIIQGT